MEPRLNSTGDTQQLCHSIRISRWCTTFELISRTFSIVHIETQSISGTGLAPF